MSKDVTPTMGEGLDQIATQRKSTPIQLTWQDIVITAHPPKGKCCKGNAILKEEKVIINDVSGTVRPGQFLAIIGASGAGKTTLLNFLSGRQISNNLTLGKESKILINNTNKNDVKNFSSLSAYVQQDDILFQTMTVRECLEFAAKLRLPGAEDAKINRVNSLITTLKLTKCENTRIGGPLVKGVSGGERKRTSIGVELITDPSLIFLDEPTTGLDSFTATSVMETLGDLAVKDGRTVVSTIHQPNSDIFEMFDRLLLLARGKIIYFNEAKLSVNYFASLNDQRFVCPELSNPCDFFMSMMSKESIEFDHEEGHMDGDDIERKYQEVINILELSYNKSDLKNDASYIHPECQSLNTNDVAAKTPFCYQFNLLAKRNFLNLIRLPQTSYVKLITTVVTAAFAALLFWQAGALIEIPDGGPKKYNQAFQNLQGALFFMTMNVSFNAIQNVILIFPDERPVFLREVNNNMYNVGPYFWAKVISELPFSIFTPCIFGCIVYFTVALNPGVDHFLIFLLALILIYNASSGYSLIISASFSDKQLAVTLTPVLIIPFMLFAGFFVSTSSIPIFLKEFEYLSIFKYGYQALMMNQFTDNSNFPCAGSNNNYVEGCYGTDPLSQISANESMVFSLSCLGGLYVFCYMTSWFLLWYLSASFD